jgi:hypothetical protein
MKSTRGSALDGPEGDGTDPAGARGEADRAAPTPVVALGLALGLALGGEIGLALALAISSACDDGVVADTVAEEMDVAASRAEGLAAASSGGSELRIAK